MAESSSSKNIAETLIESSNALLEALFRHAIHGMFLVPLWYYSNPSKFKLPSDLHFDVYGLIAFFTTAFVVGNVWYVAHRFIVHAFVDRVVWEGKDQYEKCKYAIWLAGHLYQINKGDKAKINNYVKYRA